MAVVEELIRAEADGSISFGNHTLAEKAKLEDFSHEAAYYRNRGGFAGTDQTRIQGVSLPGLPGRSVAVPGRIYSVALAQGI